MTAAVRASLEAAGKADGWQAALAVAIAMHIDTGSGGSRASLSRELRTVLVEAGLRDPGGPGPDFVDEVSRRRWIKAQQAGEG